MPVTFVDRLPLPNLKVYTATSVLMLSVSVYYAISVTSDPNWKMNVTMQRQEAQAADSDGPKMMQLTKIVQESTAAHNDSRNLTVQFVDVMSYMLQEPLCMWTLINVAYCSLALLGVLIQRAVFGKLRVSEAQHLKDKFWNYVFYKFIFVFGVINVQYMDEVLLWCSWFTVLGFLQLLALLCKDRFDYLSFSPTRLGWAHARLGALLLVILSAALALLAVAAAVGLPNGLDTFTFMAAECVLLLLAALHVCARFLLQARAAAAAPAERRAPAAYYTQLAFDTACLCVEVVMQVHMLVWSNMLVSMASLVILMQLRHLFHELRARLRKHRLYLWVLTHMDRNYPMASKEEVEAHSDNCAICWERMDSARKLPCDHLFHNSCLSQWLQQDASCPTCRRALPAPPAPAPRPARAGPPPPGPRAPLPPPPPPPNHFFHFDGSRYVSWLPSFSVEVTRVRFPPVHSSQMDAMVRQVQAMFPHYPRAVIAAELAATRSLDLAVDNILEGRVPLPPAPPAPPPPPPQRQEPPPTATAESVQPRDAAAGARSDTNDVDRTQNTDISPELVDELWADVGQVSTRFSKNSMERETMLQRRKEMLIASARRRYLEKQNKQQLDSALKESMAASTSQNS